MICRMGILRRVAPGYVKRVRLRFGGVDVGEKEERVGFGIADASVGQRKGGGYV
jgi:hypothetical protein